MHGTPSFPIVANPAKAQVGDHTQNHLPLTLQGQGEHLTSLAATGQGYISLIHVHSQGERNWLALCGHKATRQDQWPP